MNNAAFYYVSMSKGRLTKRLQKEKHKKSIAVSIRFPPDELEILNEIEEQTDIGYDDIIRMLVKRILRFWAREKKIEAPVFIVTKEQAQQLGIIDKNEDNETPDKMGKIQWLSSRKKKKDAKPPKK